MTQKQDQAVAERDDDKRQVQAQYEQGSQLTEEQREAQRKRLEQARETYEEQEKSNGDRAEERTYSEDRQPGLHPANRPSADYPDDMPWKGTRLDLEDLTHNPGHRGVNPHAPAVSVTTGESGAPVPKVTEVEAGVLPSINEPPGSVIIPPGTGGPDEHYPPLEGEDEELVITSLDPDEVELGGADVTLHVHGSGFTDASVIVFNGGDEQTTFVSESELTTLVRPSTASGVATVPVTVRDGDDESEPHDFDFIADSTPEARDARKSKRATAKKPAPKKKKKAKRK